MMSYKDFKNELYKGLKERLSNRFGSTVDVFCGTLSNGKDGLIIRKTGENTAPSLEFEMLYKDYVNSGEKFDRVMYAVSTSAVDALNKASALEAFTLDVLDYESVKKRLFLRVVNSKTRMLAETSMPSRKILDLVLTCYILKANQGDSFELSCILPVTDDMLKVYGVSEEKLFADTFENSPKIMPARVSPLVSILGELSGNEIPDQDGLPLYVVTNEKMVNGASALFYPGVMEQVSEELKGSFYAIPSSVHEFLVLPDYETNDEGDPLKNMINSVNNEFVVPGERLGEGSYYYDVNTRLFMKTEDRIRN